MKKNVDKFKKKSLWDPFILNSKKYKKGILNNVYVFFNI